jgi:hypothetical protein
VASTTSTNRREVLVLPSRIVDRNRREVLALPSRIEENQIFRVPAFDLLASGSTLEPRGKLRFGAAECSFLISIALFI